ncbi:hypothetical protein CAPTEDRAFT_212195 [Capitella teleta]|uniref:Uncharacterized protein n=1 Tax=Capitella teleta TaxID=283909 RepID=R7T9E0_CAPTE|nr:hypothetical protein CAPTEDRAFT_212195 [Capitella teleta]|eukprot:ELT90142.1 hypothetical protein CAPTEDRAFT_212195 [Capitella teleta]
MRPTTTNEPDSIYVSKDDKIVIDGLLCYMVHKLHVLNQDALKKVIVSGYSNDAIRASKEKLFKVCPGQRYVGHTGEAAATKHVRDMIKLLQERVCAHIGDCDLVLLHFLYFLTYSFWKSSIPLGITDSCEMALIRRARESIWKDAGVEFDVHPLAQPTGGRDSGASININ